MSLIFLIRIILSGILTSLYFFPFESSLIPTMNTKMIMAGIGMVTIPYYYIKKGEIFLVKEDLSVVLWAAIVSIIGLFSTVYNNSADYTYTTYIVSMFVWLSAAFVVIQFIKATHGYISVSLIINYLTAVCVGQCILALSADIYPSIKNIIDSILASSGLNGKSETRLYGIGCSLDVAGTRFSAVLILIAYEAVLSIKSDNRIKSLFYFLSFFVIGIIGNMISRTTSIGLILGLIYWIYASDIFSNQISKRIIILKYLIVFIGLVLPFVIWEYNNNETIHKHLRFAFEGFFSLWETGEWKVSSNEALERMVIWPKSLKTWIIGDAYFDNPLSTNPMYIGPGISTYYMYTDIGYLRFIYYFGLIGTVAFCIYMANVARVCINKFPSYKLMFLLILLLNYIIWLKVATDIFLVFALFLCVTRKDEEEAEENDRLRLSESINLKG